MPNKIKPRRSYTANSVPLTTDLETHELAINWADSKAFTKDASGNIVSVTLGGGGGGGGSGLSWSSVPASATATGTAGSIAYDNANGFFYVATATDTWKRAALSTWPVDPYWSSVALSLPFNGTGSTFVDSSLTPKTVTAGGNATQSATQSQTGGKSAFFNGTGDYLSFPDLGIGTGDFTIEMWLKTASTVQYAQLIGNETPDNSAGFSLLINHTSPTDGQIALYRGSNIVSSPSGSSFADNQWHHIAISRSGSTVRFYLDGALASTGTSSANFTSTAATYVGYNNSNSPRNVIGYIDDLRITVGVGRFTTGTITVPTAAFPTA